VRFLLILICLSFPLFSASLYLIDSVPDLAGNKEIRSGNYTEAKHIISRHKTSDTEYQLMKKAELAILDKDFSEAKRYLLAVISRSPELAAFSYRRIGDIELIQNDPAHAIVAYRTAAEKTELKPYRQHLIARADSVTKTYQNELKSTGWHALAYKDTVPPKDPVNDSILLSFTNRLIEGVTESQLDSLIALANKAGKGMDFKKAIRDTALIREPFSVQKIYNHARFLDEIGAYTDASRWINIAASKPGFVDSVDQKAYLSFRASLNFTLKNWENVTKYSEEYFKLFGYTPDLVMKTARSYRNGGFESKADFWYAEYVWRYPAEKESRDIIWYQAWQAEERGLFDSAIVKFRFIAKTIPDFKNADDAAFRVGLNQFRLKLYAEAATTFEQFQSAYPKSDLLPGAFYWQGRSYSAQGNDSLSQAAFATTIARWPLDYYGWRARQAMGTLDTATISTVPFTSWYNQIKLISRDPADTMGPKNSESRFRRAVQLGTLGYFTEARLLVEPVETRASKNPAQLLELSRFYELIGEHQRAFKISKNMFFTLPTAQRNNMPSEYLKRLYPKAYPEMITAATEKYSVDEHLVRSIMRQESMFHPTIVSPVGAIGLMQIMPYTGKEIASDLDTSFTTSDLYKPAINIPFGTFYIGKLLKLFDGDKVRAIASYNGGPHNVRKWVSYNKDVLEDEPFFAECIGFSETRTYVKKVLENYWTYKALNR